MVFSPIMTVRFKSKKNGKTNMREGGATSVGVSVYQSSLRSGTLTEWSSKDKKIIEEEGDKASWHSGANVSCRHHNW